MIGRWSGLTSVSARYEDMTFHNILLQNKVEALNSWVPEAEMTKDQTGYHLKKKNCHETTGKCAERWTIKYTSSRTIANLWYNYQKGFSYFGLLYW